MASDGRSLGEGVVVGGVIRHRDGVGDVEFTGASLVPVGSSPRPRDL
jgi:hypothetical protein